MSSTLFLDERDLVQLTGWKLKSRQVKWLRDAGIPFRVNATGHPVVTRAAYEAWKNPPAPPAPAPTPWREKLPLPKPWSETPLGRWQREQRQTREEADAALVAAQAALAAEQAALQASLTPDERRAQEKARLQAERTHRRALSRFLSAKRRSAKLQRTPAWADMNAIRKVYQEAQEITRRTGVPHHVDHDIPLQGALVSGLHVHNNLQILTGSENSKKRNRFDPGQ